MYKILESELPPTVRQGTCALGVMTKAPRAGAVKTRLVPPLTHEEAATLHICFLKDTAANIAALANSCLCEGIAVYTPTGTEALFNGTLPASFVLLPQRGESLGDRLCHAAEDLLAAGYKSVCLIDSDSPTLPPAALAMAVAVLSRPGDRVALGRADDGGYYLIGLKNSHPQLFTGIAWSTEKVFAQTVARAEELSLEVEALPPWYDVDDATALQHLCDELFSDPDEMAASSSLVGYHALHTRNYLAQLIETERERIWPRSRYRDGSCL